MLVMRDSVQEPGPFICGACMVRDIVDTTMHAVRQLAEHCDVIVILVDRADGDLPNLTADLVVPAIVLSVPPSLGIGPWLFPESAMLNLIYRAVDLVAPTWVVFLDQDQQLAIHPGVSSLQGALSKVEADVTGISVQVRSVWNDPEFPLMVPVMGSGIGFQVRAWKYCEGLLPGGKPLHNGVAPVNLLGDAVRTEIFAIDHFGWPTLRARIDRARYYLGRDPESRWNGGVRYDEGLLFGYTLERLDELVSEYGRRVAVREVEFRKS